MQKDKAKKEKIVLLDSHAIIHRAYHALPEFANSHGEPTGALYGLCTMLMKIITDLSPDHIIACYDLPKKTFRHEAYDGYKKGRAKTDEALVAQLIKSRDVFTAFSIPIYDAEGFEADDVLGTIVEHFKGDKNIDIVIASGDMDTMQLVCDNTSVYTLKKGINDTILYNEKAVVDRFGFKPEFLPDYKGLRGDPSDNIIGIKGIGEKTATEIIKTFGTIENLYKHLSKPSGENKLKDIGLTDRIINLLKDNEDEAIFSKTLAMIRRDAPIDFKIPEKNWRDTLYKENIFDLFRALEFKSLGTRFEKLFDGEFSPPAKGEARLNDEVGQVPEAEGVLNLDPQKLQEAKIAFWLLNSEMTNPNLDDLINYKNAQNFDEAHSLLMKDIEKNNLNYVYKHIELPIIPIIKEMQDYGVLVDVKYLKDLSEKYHKSLKEYEDKILKFAGREFNINSPKQLGEVLYDEMKVTDIKVDGLKVRMKKTAGGARSTRESELEKLRGLHPIINEILKYRELQKLLSTYIDTLPLLVKEDGRIHAEFVQTGSTTGRFSSLNPNMQNIPIKSELGKNIRNSFVAKKGSVLASFDYSQIELRVAALLSQDEYFIKVFRDGKDIHNAVASRVFGVDEKDVTQDMRRRAKVINFGILYGMGVSALQQNLGGERREAQIFYDNYFAQFPTIAGYLQSVKDFAKINGYTETLFGRRRYFPGIKSHIPFIRAMAERMAINAPIQGTATADIIKIGMKRAYDALKDAGLENEAHLVMQVHDELVYEIKEEVLDKAIPAIKNAMENAIPLDFVSNMESVPLVVSSGYGKNFGELK